MTISREYYLSFIKKERKSKDAYSFSFDRKGIDLSFLPGQYIRMSLPHENPDDRGTGRFFTVSSSPTIGDTITVTTRILESSFKKTLGNLEVGTKVRIFSPLGNFYLDEADETPKIFLTGGIGITPYHSMLQYAADKGLKTPMTLFVSFSTTQEMLFYQELTKIAKDHSHIKIVYTVTKPELSEGKWEGETGRISAELIKKNVVTLSKQKYFVVGPTALVRAIHRLLQEELKVPEEKIISENFPGY